MGMPDSPEQEPARRGSFLKKLLVLLILLVGLGAGLSFTPVGDRLRAMLPKGGGGGDDGAVVATLASIENTVKHRNPTALDWNDARIEMPLSNGHKIRTLDDSTAKVLFKEGSELVVEENSLITIRAPKKDDEQLVADIEIDDGRVRTSIARSADGKERKLQIKSGGKTVAEITTEGAQGFADVSIVVRADRSQQIVMHRGSAKVVSMGKTITLDEGKAVVADAAANTLSAPEAVVLPDPPALVFPAAKAKISALVEGTAGTATVRLGWKPVAAAAAYTVQVARDAGFATIATTSEVKDATEHPFAAPEPGEYHWRVTTVDANEISSVPSPARSFRVSFAKPKPTRTPPRPRPSPLPVVKKYELEGLAGEPLLVNGKVKKDVLKVSVNGVKAKLDQNGNYEVSLANLPPGLRVIVVESIHSDGSVTYEKKEAFIKTP